MSKKAEVPGNTLSPDITGRKQLEQEIKDKNKKLAAQKKELQLLNNKLQTSEKELYRTLTESLPIGVYIVQEGKLVFVNPQFQKDMGFTEDKLLGTSSLNTVHPDDRQLVREEAVKRLKGQVSSPYEFRTITRDGKTRVVMETMASIQYKGERAALGSHMDITERKRADQELKEKNEQLDTQNEELRATEEELRSAKEQLEERVKERTAELEATNKELIEAQEQLVRSEKLAAIGQLAGGVGHELRNPLGAIKNAVYYVREKVAKNELGQKEPRVLEFLDIVDDEINASNKIITDLLGFSRVGKPSVSPTSIAKVIEDALSYVPIPENIELIKKLDTELPQVEVDSDQIRQVLVNLVTNATQAMPEGGKLKLTARQKESFLEVKVSDTGNGISGDTIGKIFDPLFTTKAKGIGLGLAVCRTIIERHQGQIEAESEVGKGTTFTVKLLLPGKKNDMRGGADGEDQHPGG
jgi:PAS domain S-box-containing protein